MAYNKGNGSVIYFYQHNPINNADSILVRFPQIKSTNDVNSNLSVSNFISEIVNYNHVWFTNYSIGLNQEQWLL